LKNDDHADNNTHGFCDHHPSSMHSPNKSPSNTVSKENDQLDISPSEWIDIRSDNNNNSDLIIKKNNSK